MDKKLNIAILGSENSHAHHFVKAIAPKGGKGIFDDVELLGVFGEYETDGKIEDYEVIDADGCYVCAGFMDMHIHGAVAIVLNRQVI